KGRQIAAPGLAGEEVGAEPPCELHIGRAAERDAAGEAGRTVLGDHVLRRCALLGEDEIARHGVSRREDESEQEPKEPWDHPVREHHAASSACKPCLRSRNAHESVIELHRSSANVAPQFLTWRHFPMNSKILQLAQGVVGGVFALAITAASVSAKDLVVYTALEDDQLAAYKSAFEAKNPEITIKSVRHSTG